MPNIKAVLRRVTPRAALTIPLWLVLGTVVAACATAIEDVPDTQAQSGGAKPTPTSPSSAGEGGNGSKGSGGSESSSGGEPSSNTGGTGGGSSSAGESSASGAGGSGSGSCSERFWFEDVDNDGFGDAERTTKACEPPDGYADKSGDCRNDDPAVYPDSDELCDGIDNDCDSATKDICRGGCKALTRAGRSYMFCSGKLSFAAAGAACIAEQMRLARIDDAAESEFSRTAAGTETWVGGSDSTTEGTWKWLDGTTFFAAGAGVGERFVNWSTNEPNAAFPQEDCLEMLSDGKWNDCSCSEARSYLCERY